MDERGDEKGRETMGTMEEKWKRERTEWRGGGDEGEENGGRVKEKEEDGLKEEKGRERNRWKERERKRRERGKKNEVGEMR